MSKVILFKGILLCSLFAVIFVNNAMSQGTATAAPEEAKEEEKLRKLHLKYRVI